MINEACHAATTCSTAPESKANTNRQQRNETPGSVVGVVAKTVGVMQPYFFPYIGYFQHINACDTFVFLDDVDYAKIEYVGRNNLLVQGKRCPFGVEMTGGRSSRTLIKDLQLNAAPKWRGKLLKTIELNYKKAIYFEQVMDAVISPVILGADSLVAELNRNSIKACCKYLNVSKDFVDSSVVYPKRGLVGSDRVRDICKSESATLYINSIGGRDLYFHDEFHRDGLELKFLQPDMNAVTYAQGKFPWTPYLSIVDVLMWNSPELVRSFLSRYQLVDGQATRPVEAVAMS